MGRGQRQQKKKCGGTRWAEPHCAPRLPRLVTARAGCCGTRRVHLLCKPSGKLFALGGCPLPAPLPSCRSSRPAPLDTNEFSRRVENKAVCCAGSAGCLQPAGNPRGAAALRPGGPAWEGGGVAEQA